MASRLLSVHPMCLGGQGMEIVQNTAELEKYMSRAVKVSGKNPVLLDRYLKGAIEIDVDALCDSKDVYIAGIMEHIEEAGIHSGDSASVLPTPLPAPIKRSASWKIRRKNWPEV